MPLRFRHGPWSNPKVRQKVKPRAFSVAHLCALFSVDLPTEGPSSILLVSSWHGFMRVYPGGRGAVTLGLSGKGLHDGTRSCPPAVGSRDGQPRIETFQRVSRWSEIRAGGASESVHEDTSPDTTAARRSREIFGDSWFLLVPLSQPHRLFTSRVQEVAPPARKWEESVSFWVCVSADLWMQLRVVKGYFVSLIFINCVVYPVVTSLGWFLWRRKRRALRTNRKRFIKMPPGGHGRAHSLFSRDAPFHNISL